MSNGDAHYGEMSEPPEIRFHDLIVRIARRTAERYTVGSSDLCDELVQEVYLRLFANDCRLLREFVPRHEGALLIPLLRQIDDRLRKPDFSETHRRNCVERILSRLAGGNRGEFEP